MCGADRGHSQSTASPDESTPPMEGERRRLVRHDRCCEDWPRRHVVKKVEVGKVYATIRREVKPGEHRKLYLTVQALLLCRCSSLERAMFS